MNIYSTFLFLRLLQEKIPAFAGCSHALLLIDDRATLVINESGTREHYLLDDDDLQKEPAALLSDIVAFRDYLSATTKGPTDGT